jgi:O-antigen ligase
MQSPRQRQAIHPVVRPIPSARPVERPDRPGIAELPFTVVVGAISMVLVGVPRYVQFGPMSLSGALTLLVASLTLCLLPASGINAALRPQPLGAAETARTSVPWPIWGFLLFLSVSLLMTTLIGGIASEPIQNASVYLSFIGAIAFAAAVKSSSLVLRGWDLMWNVSTWFAYLALAAAALGMTSVFSTRAMAIVGVVALAVVIPGTPRNSWMKFAPFAIVAATALSLSRTSTAVGLALLVFLVLRGKRAEGGKPGGRLFKAIFMLLAAAVSAYLLVVYYAPFRDRFLVGDNALKVGDLAISTMGRRRMWEMVLSNASDSWLLGHGVGTASQLINEYFPGLGHPHNEYLRLYFDFGIVGLALFVVGYLGLAWRVLRSARKTDHPLHWAAFIALFGIALVAITDNPFVYPFVMLPLGSLVGLSLGLTRFELSHRCRTVSSGQPAPTTDRSEMPVTQEFRQDAKPNPGHLTSP